jgi:hypothetical protein
LPTRWYSTGQHPERIANSFRNQNPAGRSPPDYERFESNRNRSGASRRARRRRPPVAGRIVLKQGLSIGSAVGRGEQIGTVEQILDVSNQVELEAQRLEVEAQQREVESKRLEIRNTVLQLQGQQSEQRANASQARTQLAQAQRELRRSENLLEVGAVPRKRVEEAQTAVKVAEQSVASAEQQIRLLDNQIKQINAGQNIFRSPRVNQPTRSFALTATVTGIVNEIKASSGQLVESGTEILSISNLSTVLLEAQVLKEICRLSASQRAPVLHPPLCPVKSII